MCTYSLANIKFPTIVLRVCRNTIGKISNCTAGCSRYICIPNHILLNNEIVSDDIRSPIENVLVKLVPEGCSQHTGLPARRDKQNKMEKKKLSKECITVLLKATTFNKTSYPTRTVKFFTGNRRRCGGLRLDKRFGASHGSPHRRPLANQLRRFFFHGGRDCGGCS